MFEYHLSKIMPGREIVSNKSDMECTSMWNIGQH